MDACEQSEEHKQACAEALVLAVTHYLSLLVLVALILLFVLRPGDPYDVQLVAAAASLSGLAWVLAIRKRRSARCPLCKGVPFLERGSLTLRRASRLFPSNHDDQVIPSCSSRRFRCTYCGSRYNVFRTLWFGFPGDLVRKPAR